MAAKIPSKPMTPEEYQAQQRKVMSVEEFRDLGLLQELNRRFLHPIGLALAVEGGTQGVKLGEIWDSRNDPEGIVFDGFTPEQVERGKRLEAEIKKTRMKRRQLLGFEVQPLDNGSG